jgi:hypothetical protein
MRNRQWRFGAKAIRPSGYILMVNNISGINICQCLQRQPTSFFLLAYPGA